MFYPLQLILPLRGNISDLVFFLLPVFYPYGIFGLSVII
jgi:hypothetical protein